MAGFPIKNDIALQKFNNLFISNITNRSTQAKKHWNKLIKMGFPNSKDENWKYTPLDTFISQEFVLPGKIQLNINDVNKLSLPLDAFRLIFINGQFKPLLSSYDSKIFEIKNYITNKNIKLPQPIQPEVFLHLTEGLTEEITVIRLLSNQEALFPIYLLHITDGYQDRLNTVHYRHHLILEDNTKAEIIEHFVTLNLKAHFTGSRLTVNIANNSNLRHVKLAFESSKSYHFSHNDIIIGNHSKIISNTFVIGANIMRHNTSIKLEGNNSELIINSLSLPKDQEIFDIRTHLEHNKSYCTSRQKHKAIVLDRGRSVFNGHIKVASDAIKTDGKMINNNLLLGTQAEVYTKPQLEIYADDVKCSHGATVGCIDDKQIFYLISRGISTNDAMRMLIDAFAIELIEILENSIIKKAILNRMYRRISREDM
ncbi:FeS cluster assembly protein SufD [Candidatus Pantoea edessiphila]|uniref:FeS cluster assembly protein SufD n=1 Tax=Candidatus Pantoea edessiphila TaxID=2044610 RepID=A0A2P5T2K0_9GAMM|nr:Fe-S cluster assembly protein SufD [Candidatus Pantoea edessiphila]PPI88807.1 FeS cluster assembly protein SufD [Candidatus Pantoea edessiphila]